ncbi:MAG: flagellar protein FlaG [Thiohalobacteraceae bacterium]
MSTDLLKAVGLAALPSPNPSAAVANVPEFRSVEARKDVAAAGGSLPQPEESTEAEKVEEAVNQVNEYVQNLNRDLQFTVDQDSGRTVIKVLDSETQEVIRQIPSEELLQIANQLTEGGGLLLKVQA